MRVGFILFLFFLMGNVLAVEGVSPGSYSVDFELGLEREFIFDFVLDDKQDLVIEGDLRDYVQLSRDYVWGENRVVVRLKLPQNFSELSEANLYPGVNNIWIVAGNARGVIKILVPYPDKYVDAKLAAPNVNVGKDVNINLKVSNFGRVDAVVDARVEVVFDGEVAQEFEGEEIFLGVSEIYDYDFVFNSFNYSAGDYSVRAFVDSGGEEKIVEDGFRLGKKAVLISNYTREIKSGGLGKFEIEVESLWDEDMKEVYAEVRVIGRQSDDGVSLERDVGFDSSIVSLGAWEKKRLVGYFDSEEIEGEIMLSIDVYFDGEVESEVVRVDVVKKIGWWIWGLSGLVLVFLGLGVWRKISRFLY